MVSPPIEPVIIKKYGNRRLYDTRRSQYITLEDLAGIVRSGSPVKVVEASSDRDLTRQVLTQVILEQQEALDLVPVELLHALIRVQGTLEQAPFAAFLAAVTSQFVSRGNLLAQQLASFMGSFPGFGATDPGRGAARPTAPSTSAAPPAEAAPPASAHRPLRARPASLSRARLRRHPQTPRRPPTQSWPACASAWTLCSASSRSSAGQLPLRS